MNKDTYNKKMKIRTVYHATLNGQPVKVRKPDSGGIVDYDEPTKEYAFQDIVLGLEIKPENL